MSVAFNAKRKFPHAIGAIVGKHAAIKTPAKRGTKYYNNKQFLFMVLLVVADADCNFMFVDVGCKGRISDNRILRTSRLYGMLGRKELNILEAEPLNLNSSIRVPYMLLGHKAFALTDYCMRPLGGVTENGSNGMG